MRIRRGTYLVLLLMTLISTGCQSGPFSGAASMRVDVEVYKGPLAEEPELQWGGLLGHLQGARKALIETDNFTRAVIANKGFQGMPSQSWPLPRISTHASSSQELKPSDLGVDDASADSFCKGVTFDNPWYYFKFWTLFGVLDDLDHYDCLILSTLVSDTVVFITQIDSLMHSTAAALYFNGELTSLNPEDVRAFVTKVGQLSAQLRDQAFRWAIASTSGQSLNFKVRIAAVNTIVAFSEIGNQLKCRANALAKQIDGSTGLDRRELAPSVALCDAEPTNFANLYALYDAATPGLIAKYWQGIGWVEDRVKIVKDLFSDHYWSRINTVYASGRGKVSMAFIKDDVGNWNLKSFDNDPEELLKAYKDFTVETIRRAAMMVQSVSPGAAAAPAMKLATGLLEKASATAFGSTPSNDGVEAMVIPKLHKKVAETLTTLANTHQDSDATLLSDYTSKRDLLEKTNEPLAKAELEKAVDTAKKALIAERRQMIKDIQQVIADHERMMSYAVSE